MKLSLPKLAIRNLKRKAFRTGVLVLSIGLLVCLLVFGLSFIFSVTSSLERASKRLGADVLVVPTGAREVAQEVLLETKIKTFYMDKSLIDRIKKVEGVGEITVQTYLETIMGVCCDIPPAKVVAFNQKTDFIVSPWLKKIIKEPLRPGQAILGHKIKEDFVLYDVDSSVLFGTKFDIIGVLEKTDTGLDNAIFISDENLEEIAAKGQTPLKPDKVSLVFVRAKKGYDPEKVGRAIENDIVEVDVISRTDVGKKTISTINDISRVFFISIVLACVLAASLTWTIFSAIVNERCREIGLMRAIGAKQSHIAKAFILEVLMLGLMGSAIGVVAGTAMSLLLSKAFVLLQDVTATLSIVQRMEVAAVGLIAGVAICMVGAFSSVLRGRKLEPLCVMKEG